MGTKIIIKITIFTTVLFIMAGMLIYNPLTVMACGYGNSGGSDFVPKRQGPYNGNQSIGNQAAVTIGQEQARSIVKNHITRLNPDLTIGGINDAGGFFEVEVMNKAKEVLQVLGVDKYSGRLMLLN